MEQASEQLLRLSMELGGNAPFLVFDDADLDAAVEGRCWRRCATSARLHLGQPLSRRRVRADEFTSKLAERMGAMKLGRGTEDDVKSGR
jgi:succinate-semialdehyde dehydrogenase/glutarate-semialdehyde dehydrogenase